MSRHDHERQHQQHSNQHVNAPGALARPAIKPIFCHVLPSLLMHRCLGGLLPSRHVKFAHARAGWRGNALHRPLRAPVGAYTSPVAESVAPVRESLWLLQWQEKIEYYADCLYSRSGDAPIKIAHRERWAGVAF
jgi:hypothetical protein